MAFNDNKSVQSYQQNSAPSMQFQMVAPVTNKFGATTDNSGMARELAEIQAKVFMAKTYPRDMEEVKQKILSNCSRLEMAKSAIYQYPRGGQKVEGPSIRLAEMLALAFGNIESKTEVLDQNAAQSLVKVSAWDYESNRQSSRTFIVRHERDTRSGRIMLVDNRDITEMINNIAARNRRACLLELIPGDYVELAVRECAQTIESKLELTQEIITNMVEAFKINFGISKEQLEDRIGMKVESITAKKFYDLDSIYSSLQDGIGKPEQFFNMDLGKEKEAETSKRKNPSQDVLIGKAKKQPANASTEKKPETTPAEGEGALKPASRTAETVSGTNIDSIVDAFAYFGVTRKQLEDYIECPLQDATKEDVDTLSAAYRRISSGETPEYVLGIVQEGDLF